MNAVRFPLLAKVLAWLVLHLLILGLLFFVFVRWQLGMGLDSLLSGSAGERIGAFGDRVVSQIMEKPPRQWNGLIQPLAAEKDVTAAIFQVHGAGEFPRAVPPNVLQRAKSVLPPPRADGPPGGGHRRPPGPRFDGPGGRPPPPDFGQEGPPPREDDETEASAQRQDLRPAFLPKSKPAFLLRADNGDGYWAGVLLHLPPGRGIPNRPVLLLVRAEDLSGSGMFFDYKPWLWGGLAVLMLSIAFWTPFVWGITRYVRRLTHAADRISSGVFQVSIPQRGRDELGNLGRTIEMMAARLDHLISGQKRFLGDAAHELCAPLARIRTGLGVLEMKLTDQDAPALASIESDVAELATLVNEILAFSRVGCRSASLRRTELEPFVRETLVRESTDIEVETVVPPGLWVEADPVLLGRAVGNLIRNAAIHAGPGAKVTITAAETPGAISLTVADNGPGVPPAEITRLFEPFYRVDRSRSRDTGGSGLGLAIVRSAIETCGGEVSAALPEEGGFAVTIRLPGGGLDTERDHRGSTRSSVVGKQAQ